MAVRRWPAVDLELHEDTGGLVLHQSNSTCLAREWALTEQVESFVSACVDAGLGCFIRHSHPKVSNRANGVHYLCASRAADERWVVGIDQFSPKVTKAGQTIRRLIVESHYRLALDEAGIAWDWQSSSARNIHVSFDDLGRLLQAVVPWVEDIEQGLGTRRWEQVKARIGFVTEAVLESWMVDRWQTLPFGRDITLVGNQIERVDIVGRVRASDSPALFELKRVPADLGTLDQLHRYLAKWNQRSGGERTPAWGAIVAPTFSPDLVATVAAAGFPLALWRYRENNGLLGLQLEADNWAEHALGDTPHP
jgi:hypothetical protein